MSTRYQYQVPVPGTSTRAYGTVVWSRTVGTCWYQQVPLTGNSYRIVYMKILLRASASPRAARPPRPTSASVPVKHRNRKNSGLKPNFFIINSNYYFGRRPDPVTTSNLKKNPVTASGMTRKPRATALYSTHRDWQAQARRISSALPQSRYPYLHHIQVVKCGRRRYVLHPSSIGNYYIAHRRDRDGDGRGMARTNP